MFNICFGFIHDNRISSKNHREIHASICCRESKHQFYNEMKFKVFFLLIVSSPDWIEANIVSGKSTHNLQQASSYEEFEDDNSTSSRGDEVDPGEETAYMSKLF